MRFATLILTATAAMALTGCTPATNAPANTSTNANAAKPVSAAPTKEALFDMDKKANEAYVHGDANYFETNLSDKFVMYMGGKRFGKTDSVKMIGTVKCEMKDWSLSGPEMSKIDADTYVISYKGTFDGSCAEGGGKMQKAPSPVRGATVWARNGDKWQAVFHGETPIMEPKGGPDADDKADAKDAKSTDAKQSDAKKTDADKDSKTSNDKSAAKTEDKNMADDKSAKAADDKSMAKRDDKTAANTTRKTTDAGTADPNTDALVALHKTGWEAWRTKDASKLEQSTTADVAFIGPDGIWHSGKSDVVKNWTTMNCEGVTKTDFKNGFASALSPTVEILTGIGTSDGKCNGQKNADLENVAFYVKEGNDWKLAFMFEPMPMG